MIGCGCSNDRFGVADAADVVAAAVTPPLSQVSGMDACRALG